MTKEELIAVALQFRIQKLWEELDDSMTFGVRLPDGETGYCCVMGNGGQHYALGLYKGVSGFSTYINSVNRAPGTDSFEMFMTYDCMNCDYENASESNLTSAQKKQIRTVANECHIKMCRPNGYPEFIRYDRGVIRTELNDEEMSDLGIALKAGIEVASRVKGMTLAELGKFGFGEDGYYPSPAGGDRIPMLEMQADGSFKWSVTVTPKANDTSFSTPLFSNILATGRLKTMPCVGAFQCKVLHMHAPVKNKEGVFYPLLMVLVNDEGMMYPVMQKSNDPHAEEELLNQLAFTLISMESYPDAFFVDDAYSEAFLKDFCKKTGIKLKKVGYLPELEEVVHMLRSQFGR
ncbi:MAG: hypothetical protein K2N25_05460 [Muribaculaceae bacterium]|nr:hypothetical protein [Muribaculaceae bacterium]